MSNNIDLSIIIISSKSEYLFGCLDTLTPAVKKLSTEIILVDNASQDRIGDLTKKKFPEVKVLRRESNGGFGENNNMGLKVASGRYVLLLNDDTQIIQKDILREMIDWMNNHPKVGLSGCALVNQDGKTFQGNGGYYPTIFRVFSWMMFIDDIPGVDTLIKPYHPLHSWSPFYKGENYFKKEHQQDWITGAFFLMRKEALDEVGFFDEDFFLYVEEVELSARFIKRGWQVWYLPKWKIIHFGQITTGSEKAMFFELQNLVLLYKKHESKWKNTLLRAILKLGSLLRVCLWYVMAKPDTAKVYAKAFKSI